MEPSQTARKRHTDRHVSHYPLPPPDGTLSTDPSASGESASHSRPPRSAVTAPCKSSRKTRSPEATARPLRRLLSAANRPENYQSSIDTPQGGTTRRRRRDDGFIPYQVFPPAQIREPDYSQPSGRVTWATPFTSSYAVPWNPVTCYSCRDGHTSCFRSENDSRCVRCVEKGTSCSLSGKTPKKVEKEREKMKTSLPHRARAGMSSQKVSMHEDSARTTRRPIRGEYSQPTLPDSVTRPEFGSHSAFPRRTDQPLSFDGTSFPNTAGGGGGRRMEKGNPTTGETKPYPTNRASQPPHSAPAHKATRNNFSGQYRSTKSRAVSTSSDPRMDISNLLSPERRK